MGNVMKACVSFEWRDIFKFCKHYSFLGETLKMIF